ncbi:hypothetical protein [Martelella endophytica]|uniref:Uncharacterized protein n=1 Tax=Martelella endophytica TaxID=1486262 RepID=A0A0D5LMN3_MAREN|nr:hypothetical protein [Martelella endophytica]AJY45454.1 hypothetical protein TM49_06680 [Martelella endophytica]
MRTTNGAGAAALMLLGIALLRPGTAPNAQELTGRAALFQDQTPIEMMASNYQTFETGYTQPKGSVLLQFGSHQSLEGAATGTEIYEGRADWAITDRIQIGAFGSVFDDPLLCDAPGCSSNLTMLGGGVTGKYRMFETPFTSISLAGSVEGLYLAGDLYGNDDDATIDVVGSVQAPLSYSLDDSIRLHLVPGVSFLPDQVNGYDYFGTIPWLGAGITIIPFTGLQGYATVTMPFAQNGNVIANTGEFKNVPVWTAGVRVGITPKSAVDIFATNSFGATPATGVLALSSDRSDIAFGVRFDYTPFVGTARRDVYFDSYRASQLIPVTRRAEQLQTDGFTLTSAATYSPKTFVVEGSAMTGGTERARFSYAPDQDIQFDAIFSKYGTGGSAGNAPDPWDGEWAYMFGGKLRLLDQNYGDIVSVSGQVLAGRDFEKPTTGVLYASLPISYSLSEPLTLTLDPRMAFYHDERVKGIGFGVNARAARDLELIGEYTYVLDDSDAVWAAGARYSPEGTPLSFDAFATNATGMTGVGTLMAQDDARFGVSARLRF